MRKTLALSKSIQRLSIAGLIIGALLMILHWPYGREIAYYAKITLIASSFIHLLVTPSKSYGHWTGIIALSSYTIYFYGFESLLFADNYLLILAGIGSIIWYWDVGTEQNKLAIFGPVFGTPFAKKDFVYFLAAAVILIGALFKIMHYPLADTLLIFGLGLIVLQMIRMVITKEADD